MGSSNALYSEDFIGGHLLTGIVLYDMRIHIESI